MLARPFFVLILSAALVPWQPAGARCHRQSPDYVSIAGGDAAADSGAAADKPEEPRRAKPVEKQAPIPSEEEEQPAPEPPAPELPAPPPTPPAAHAVSAGETLRTALTRWTSGEGWELVWDAPNDYTLGAAATFGGGLVEAVNELMESLRANGAPFGAEVWEGNRVVRVTRAR